MTTSDVSVVVAAYDLARWTDLEAALESLARQSLAAAEIIVVVDHNEALLERARESFPSAHVVSNRGRRGVGETRNVGIAHASSAIVAFLDDDAVASANWLRALVAAYEDPDVAGAGGPVEPSWAGVRPPWFPAEFQWVVGCSYRGMTRPASGLRNLLGCNMSFRRELLTALGGFRIGYSCDETELCIRLRQRWPSKRLVDVPEASVRHAVARDRQTLSYFLSRCYFEGGSKAVVAALVGPEEGLSSERTYSRRVLPAGVARGVRDATVGRDAHGLGRAAAIVAGFSATAAGYVVARRATGRAASRRGWTGAWPPHTPAAAHD